MTKDEATTDVGERISMVADGADLGGVADALERGRAIILSRWLASAARQSFHESRHDGAVADHIPILFDATVALLRRERATTPTPRHRWTIRRWSRPRPLTRRSASSRASGRSPS